MQMMISQPAVSTQSSPLSSNSQKATSASSLFSQLLTSTGVIKEENGDGLGGIILNLLSEVPELDWDAEAIDSENVQAILNEMPPEMKEMLEKLLQEQIDLSEVAVNPAQEMKLALLLQAIVNDQNGTLSPTGQKQVSAIIEKWFPGVKLDQKDSITKQVEQILGQVKKLLNDESTQDKAAFLKVTETLTAVKKAQSYADQAFQRYVPTKQTEQTVSSIKELQTVQSPLTPLEQWTLKVPVSQGEGQKEQFVRDVQRIITSGKIIVNEAGFTKMNIRLTPEHLGTIEIQLIQKHGEIAAKIIASNQGAKEALDGQLTQLKQAFSSQNIEFEKVEVFVKSDEQNFEFHDQGNQGYEDQQQTSESGKDETELENLSFEEQLSQLVLNEKV
ncbi:flagellar hook-length control protein FliK [Fictibacillus sp. b24]|uniref:flagellar hook-length control protein FliK n=1 Tax=Fictibacillus sp. b24 TaxID=3055863 RepID=UPI0025A1AE19|nr:flagellar hook-length control protein FliK [Fictibacillus sp. b24]MDM5316527.1 flagellar hook-length control protein FliK [Fictibacillus sp. b24]